tara:strand:- start:1279 stop:1827 length:549 start_codon:yes stop_codon:yes gene_type:complete
MAKISNTGVYPNVTPKADDYFILTDASDSKKTKTTKVSDLSAYISGSLSSDIITAVVTVSSAQIQSLNSSPVTLLNSSTKIIVPLSIVVRYNYGTIAYTVAGLGNNYIGIDYVSAGSIWAPVPNLNGVVGSTQHLLQPSTGNGAAYQTATNTSKLIWYYDANDPAAGDGTVTFNIQYREITF